MDAHSFAARNIAHLYAVGGRQHMRMWLRERTNIAAYCFILDLDELREGHAKRIRFCEEH